MTFVSRHLAPTSAVLAAVCLHGAPADAGGTVNAVPPQALAVVDSTDRPTDRPADRPTDRLIVRLRDREVAVTTDSQAARVGRIGSRLGVWLQRLRSMSGNAPVVQLSRMQSRDEAVALARKLAQDPDVLDAEPDLRMVPLRMPNDTAYPQQWHYFEAVGGINLPAAWDRTVGSSNITVAVIDTGLVAHPDLAGRTVAGWGFIADTTTAQDGDGRDADPSDPDDCGCNGSASSWHGTPVAAFEVQTWTKTAWSTVPGGTLSGNDKVWRKFSFPAITTSAVRVLVTAALAGYSGITAIEVYGPP